VDDNSSEEDRVKMKEKYPFFEFYFKTPQEKGHPRSMNIIRDKVKTPYIFHMEDDWQFISKRKYISECMDVLSQSDKFGQCLVNRNYAETERDFKILGGIENKTNAGTRFFIHEYCATEEELNNFNIKYGNSPNCAYWKHFSFRPSLLIKHILTNLGAFDEKVSHFEMEYSSRYSQAGYLSTFLDDIYCLHIGRLTSERFDPEKTNAYVLNDEKQLFGKEEPQPSFKTYVLNLDRRPDRMESFRKSIEGIDLQYERFSAIDGSKLTPNKQLQRIFEGNDYNMREGMVGCAMSHVKMYIELINSKYDFFCILEDDVTFVPDFLQKFKYTCDNLPKEWDICYLGHHLWKKFKTADYYDKEAYPIFEKWSTKQSLKYSMGGTGGYLISKNGARKFLEILNKVGMLNGIDTMQQKSADLMNIYYCKPHLIYSDCCTPEKTSDTDIQYNYKSLDMLKIVSVLEYPERLKKNGIYDIREAIAGSDAKIIAKTREPLVKPPTDSLQVAEAKREGANAKVVYLFPCSETTHTYEAVKELHGMSNFSILDLPFNSTDGGTMENFAEVIKEIISCTDFDTCSQKFVNNSYGIIFPHDKGDLCSLYSTKLANLKKILTSSDPVFLIHVSRWRKVDVKVFEELLSLCKNLRIITVNGLPTSTVSTHRLISRQLEFPEKWANDDWSNQYKIAYDQTVFRVRVGEIINEVITK
jgi:GR25 family glycosyltransferase involved in LPS biosynthesis